MVLILLIRLAIDFIYHPGGLNYWLFYNYGGATYSMVFERQSDFVSRIINLRYLVGFLGERTQCNWWSTSFYEASSIRFLEPVFSRTAPLAKYYGALEAARRLHDENLSVGSFHLFRLPEEIEKDLHEMLQSRLFELFDPDLIVDWMIALNAVSKDSIGVADEAVGPVLVGKVEEFRTPEILDKISQVYRMALSSNTPAFPYLAA